MINQDYRILDIIQKKILSTGPISLSDYMKVCLTHPKHGYYIRNKPIGSTGDFITSPEISQMFGELIGLWIVQIWLDHKKPPNFSLIELGPGNGTLMKDILRSTKMIKGFHDALHLILIEISPTLSQTQKKALGSFRAHWQTEIGSFPEQPTVIIANEFFDSLPIRQFKRERNQWMEVMITIKDPSKKKCNKLSFGLRDVSMNKEFASETDNIPEGTIIEFSELTQSITNYISDHIKKNTGAALIIDYGKEGNVGDTFQAVRQHQYSNPLKYPGLTDLTSYVDFNAIRNSAERSGLIASKLSYQADFLKNLGIEQRAKMLSQKLPYRQLRLHQAALKRLIHHDEMGHLFKVLGLRSPTSPPLIGLEI